LERELEPALVQDGIEQLLLRVYRGRQVGQPRAVPDDVDVVTHGLGVRVQPRVRLRTDEIHLRETQDHDVVVLVHDAEVLLAEQVTAIDADVEVATRVPVLMRIEELLRRREAATTAEQDRKSTRLNSSHVKISYA